LKTRYSKTFFRRLHGQGVPSFTLVELLVVVAIIGLLAGLLIPVITKAIASGKTGKATGNLRQIGTLLNAYAVENNGSLPILINHWGGWPPWQYLLMESVGTPVEWSRQKTTGLYLVDWVYDPGIKNAQRGPPQHPYGGFGGNDAILLGLRSNDNRDCLRVFGHDRGTPLNAIGPLSKKVVVASATDSQGSQWKSSWLFNGAEWVAAGPGYTGPKPDPRHGSKTLCLFADGHTELLDTDKMSAADRRKYFLLPQFE
jgi:prepilin-type N-terminal cleavage/methylation domain-containing protein/prepilin-type processing-associated H-X9-DG protein